MRRRNVKWLLAFWGLLVAGLGQAVWAADPVNLRGEFIQGGMLIGEVVPGAKVMVDGNAVRVADNGVFVFGLDRDAPAQQSLKVVLPDGSSSKRVLTIEQRDYPKQYIEGIAKRIMQPNPDDLKRIRSENAQVAKARKQDISRQDFLQRFIWPLKGPITGVFGSQRVYNGEPRRPHYGVDVAAATGTEVVAPADGVVTLAHNDMFYSGGTLILDHGHGISSSFLHLSAILVAEGQEIKQGQPIAKVGATGRVTGAHLDWRMNWFGKRIDAALLVPPMEEVLAQDAAIKNN